MKWTMFDLLSMISKDLNFTSAFINARISISDRRSVVSELQQENERVF